jgi:hypothetical protein
MLEVIDKGRCTDEHRAPLLFVHGGSLAAWCWDEHFLDFFADKGFRGAPVEAVEYWSRARCQRRVLITCRVVTPAGGCAAVSPPPSGVRSRSIPRRG